MSMRKIFFTSDEHYGHNNIIKYCKRPFGSIREMDDVLISNHNQVVGKDDVVYHLGDFTLSKRLRAQSYVDDLNGSHTFIKGSHDYWLGKNYPKQIIEQKIDGRFIVMCHYCMRVWARSHFNSWHIYGHSHGGLSHDFKSMGKSWDVGVDNNAFYPVSFEQLEDIMAKLPDNPNYRPEYMTN